jgi:transposase
MSSIIHLTDQRQYHLYRKETDKRKGFDSLCGIITNELGKPVMNGDAFIFINKPRTHLKLLVWEQDGFTIVYHRIEKGTFEVPAFNLDQDSLHITADQLHCILKGIKLSSVKYRKRYQQKAPVC